ESGSEKPARPVVTPQFSVPRALTSSSVAAAAAPASRLVTVRAPRNTVLFIFSSSQLFRFLVESGFAAVFGPNDRQHLSVPSHLTKFGAHHHKRSSAV